MSVPLFYTPDPEAGVLDGSEAFHITKALRAKAGTTILITDGKGNCVRGSLTSVSSKQVGYTIEEILRPPTRPYEICIGIAPTRKPERNEWMVEKLVELGIDRIAFIKTTHTHLESFNRVVNHERLEKIAIAAMKQSGQYQLPAFSIGQDLETFITHNAAEGRYIAYVPDKAVATHLAQAATGVKSTVVLIGPEGDFSQEEVTIAIESGFKLVSLGTTRLRTETAAIAACHAIHIAQLT